MTRNTIGQVARTAGVGVETVRYYERRRLIRRPPSPSAGYREYPGDTADRIRFIRHAQDLGFTLEEIRDLLSLRADPRLNCERIRVRAEAKVAAVDAKIRSLRRIKSQLVALTEACDRREASAECPILEALR